ncbi:MAG: hypothetical protein AAF480_11215 [Actinomycetota bacterium]
MSALDRWDDLEAGVDDDLAEVYDAATLRAIDRQVGEPPTPAVARGWRGGATAGAMVLGMVQGVRDALEDEESEPVVEIDEDLREARHQAVTVHLAWGNPSASVAIVRPWLL